MTAVALPRTGLKFMVTVRDGPDIGAVFQLLPPRVTIGRGGGNNVALQDPRVSRQAAVIDFSLEKILITDISGRENMMINGYAMKEAELNDGDLIYIGETQLRFTVEALALQGVHAPAARSMVQSSAEGPAFAAQPGFRPTSGIGQPRSAGSSSGGMNEETKKKVRFYAIIGAGLAIFLYLMMSEDKKKSAEKGIPTVQQIEESIKASETNRNQIEKRHFKTEEERTRANESKRHFLEGFRDYQKGQWVRALRSFETAQAIDRNNVSAGRYAKLAEKQRDEMINVLTLEGRRYREKAMYSRCSAAFEKVLIAIPNKQDLKYKAAEALKAECDAMMNAKVN